MLILLLGSCAVLIYYYNPTPFAISKAVVDPKEACCPHICRLPQLPGSTLTLNFHPKPVPQGLSGRQLIFVRF